MKKEVTEIEKVVIKSEVRGRFLKPINVDVLYLPGIFVHNREFYNNKIEENFPLILETIETKERSEVFSLLKKLLNVEYEDYWMDVTIRFRKDNILEECKFSTSYVF